MKKAFRLHRSSVLFARPPQLRRLVSCHTHMHYLSLVIFAASLTCFNYSGCCRPIPPQPTRPTSIGGWKDSASDSTFRFRAVLLLREGESSSNGNVGVRVTNILEAQPCGDVATEYHRRATVQFFNPSSGHLFCEELVADKSNVRISCADKVGADVISVRDISTAEKWVLFDLRY